ncbi:MAG: ATP-dependent protease ATPase subunit HslU [Balneolaceae bacterium]|nr:MAG: ATP-dependent protease ATPase subunit HslU [Balneolaceae bacterium]
MSNQDYFETLDNLTPGQIVKELDRFIIGQNAAKKSVAIALRNRWRRLNADESIRDEIVPNNIILIGPTGVGKTEIARRLAKLSKAPFIKVEASKYTEVGYVGRDVESMIRDLTDIGVAIVKMEMQDRVKKRAEELVEERILDLLIPPVKKPGTGTLTSSTGFRSQSEEFDPATASDEELNQRTREKFRDKLKKGELDERKVELEVRQSGTPTMQIFGPQGLEELGMNLQDMLGNLAPKKTKKRQVKISEARKMLLAEESEKLIDHDAAVTEALKRVQSAGIVFLDEIDKIAGGSSGEGKGGPDVSRQGVQRDLLPIVEGSTVSTKYGMVKTDHILFIASGAFHIAKPSDLIPELQGRFPIRVEMDSLTEEDFYLILTTPQNALTKQYQAILASEGVTLHFDDDAIREIARIAAEVNLSIENIGARRLHTILSSVLEELLFAVPDDIKTGEITIDKAYVEKQLDSLVKNRDLSHFIL